MNDHITKSKAVISVLLAIIIILITNVFVYIKKEKEYQHISQNYIYINQKQELIIRNLLLSECNFDIKLFDDLQIDLQHPKFVIFLMKAACNKCYEETITLSSEVFDSTSNVLYFIENESLSDVSDLLDWINPNQITSYDYYAYKDNYSIPDGSFCFLISDSLISHYCIITPGISKFLTSYFRLIKEQIE